MKKFFKDCENCDGYGYNVYNDTCDGDPRRNESYDCTYCDEGKVVNTDEVDFKIGQIEEMLDGFAMRVSIFQDMANKCKLGYLDNLARKFEKRIELCKKAMVRLNNYKNKLESL